MSGRMRRQDVNDNVIAFESALSKRDTGSAIVWLRACLRLGTQVLLDALPTLCQLEATHSGQGLIHGIAAGVTQCRAALYLDEDVSDEQSLDAIRTFYEERWGYTELSVETILAGMTSGLRSPLASFIQGLQILYDQGYIPPESEAEYHFVRETALRLMALWDQVRIYIRGA